MVDTVPQQYFAVIDRIYRTVKYEISAVGTRPKGMYHGKMQQKILKEA